MPYRLKLDEPLAHAVRRIGMEQLEASETKLSAGDVPAVAVHDVRKALKRVRALLRLVRPALGNRVFEQENTRLRDIGRLLSGTRDQHVLEQTLAAIESRFALGQSGITQGARLALAEAGPGGGTRLAPDSSAARTVRQRLRKAATAFADLPVRGSGFEPIAEGLETAYRRARKALTAAEADGSDETVHEWRKQVQHHWRHMLLLTRVWPEVLQARAHEAKALSQILGEDHDLAMLARFLHSEAAASVPRDQRAALDALCRARQGELRRAAAPRAHRLFAEPPRALRKRLTAYWHAARHIPVTRGGRQRDGESETAPQAEVVHLKT